MFTELYTEEKREEGDRGGQEDKGGIKRREREISHQVAKVLEFQLQHPFFQQTPRFDLL